MTVDHVVDNLDEAVALATEWKTGGTHRWFRGQAQPWNLVSSLSRYTTDDPFMSVEARYARICDWLSDQEQLRHLLDEDQVHAMFGVMQHYGIPTNYIDFSTEPITAGFFATHDEAAVPGTQGCIIAMDPESFVSSLVMSARVQGIDQDNWPEAISVKVPDLWRMQAQSGHFLYLPVVGVENWYGYDRIVFTHTDQPSMVAVDNIYPPRKSKLEVRLDEFFTEELRASNRRVMKKHLEKWKEAGAPVSYVSLLEEPAVQYLVGEARPHHSWDRINRGWFAPPTADYWSAHRDAPIVVVRVDHGDLSRLRDDTAEQVRQLLGRSPDCRDKAVRWTASGLGDRGLVLERRLERVWDGMRGLPYTDGQLTIALAATAATAIDDRAQISDLPLQLATARVTSRAVAPPEAVRRAFRDDLVRILRDPALAEAPRMLLQVVHDPALVYDFDRLVDLFAEHIIPRQVVHDRLDLAVFFSPTDVTTIGIA